MAENQNDSSIEVGPGRKPMLDFLRADLRPGTPMYIERNPEYIDALRKELESEGRRSGQIIEGDINNINLPPNSANSIFLKDVFSQHGIPRNGHLDEIVDIGDMNHIISELHKVCRENGKIIVLDVGTPLNKNELLKKFASHGFSIKEDYGKKDINRIFSKEDPEAEITGRSVQATAAQDAYALVFEKTIK